MQRRWLGRLATVIVLVAFIACSTPLAAEAQPAGTAPRIAFLCAIYCPAFSVRNSPEGRAFFEALRELGYIEGQNIVVDYRGAGVAYESLARFAVELVRHKAAVILAGGLAAAQAAQEATGTIPIVMFAVPDAVEHGLIRSLARPGGNMTGITIPFAELVAKQLEVLTEAVPGASRVAVLSNPGNPEHAVALKGMEVVARRMGVELQSLAARSRSHSELEPVFAALRRGRAGLLFVLSDPVFSGGEVTLFAIKNRIPTISMIYEFAQAGGLMAYGPNRLDMSRSAAVYVGKILRGAKPTNLPVEQPTRFELVINLNTAKALGLTIPQSLLFRADQVIE